MPHGGRKLMRKVHAMVSIVEQTADSMSVPFASGGRKLFAFCHFYWCMISYEQIKALLSMRSVTRVVQSHFIVLSYFDLPVTDWCPTPSPSLSHLRHRLRALATSSVTLRRMTLNVRSSGVGLRRRWPLSLANDCRKRSIEVLPHTFLRRWNSSTRARARSYSEQSPCRSMATWLPSHTMCKSRNTVVADRQYEIGSSATNSYRIGPLMRASEV
jgi:hypothetical protein